MAHRSKTTSILVATLAGILMASCADTKVKDLIQDKPNVEPQGELVEPVDAQVNYTPKASDDEPTALEVTLQIPNSMGEIEELKNESARVYVNNGSSNYDYFRGTEGETLAAFLVRNDNARLSMAFVINQESTFERMKKQLLSSADGTISNNYDAVYVFDHTSTNSLNGSFTAKMYPEDITALATELDISEVDLVEMLRVALVDTKDISSVEELVDLVVQQLEDEESTEGETGDPSQIDEPTEE